MKFDTSCFNALIDLNLGSAGLSVSVTVVAASIPFSGYNVSG
jgi:hypothetical protein